MAQLCLWTKIRYKQWLVLGASAFQCMRAGFLCPKCDNFACLHTRQNQNELHLKSWFFFQNPHQTVIRFGCVRVGVFTGLGPRWLFPLAKTEDIDACKAFCNDWGDKRKIETGACWRYQKVRFRSVSRIGKNAGISVLYLRRVGLLWRGQDNYW